MERGHRQGHVLTGRQCSKFSWEWQSQEGLASLSFKPSEPQECQEHQHFPDQPSLHHITAIVPSNKTQFSLPHNTCLAWKKQMIKKKNKLKSPTILVSVVSGHDHKTQLPPWLDFPPQH